MTNSQWGHTASACIEINYVYMFITCVTVNIPLCMGFSLKYKLKWGVACYRYDWKDHWGITV